MLIAVVVQLLHQVWLFVTLCYFCNHMMEMQVQALSWGDPHLPPLSPSLSLLLHQDFSKRSAFLIRWPKYWSFSFSISASNKYPRLIFFRTDWFVLFEVEGILKQFFQHQHSKPSILRCSNFPLVQLSHPYMATGKIIVLTIWACIYLCEILNWYLWGFFVFFFCFFFFFFSMFVIANLPRNNHALISWLQSLSVVILEPKKRKSVTVSNYSPSIYLEVMGLEQCVFVLF